MGEPDQRDLRDDNGDWALKQKVGRQEPSLGASVEAWKLEAERMASTEVIHTV